MTASTRRASAPPTQDWTISAASTAFLSMAFAFVVWWWYFEGADASAERRIRTRRQLVRFRVWDYSHLPLFLGIGVAGVGFERAISQQAGQGRILCEAVGSLMLALIAIGACSEKRAGRARRIRMQSGLLAALILLWFFAERLDQLALVFCLLTACVIQTVLSQSRPDVGQVGNLRRVGNPPL